MFGQLKIRLACVSICTICVSGCGCHKESIEAEKTLHAYYLVLDILMVYAQSNDGRWPQKWDDLKGVTPERKHPIWIWPNDLASISQRVEVDFGWIPDGDTVPTRFYAVRQLGPNYGPDDAWIKELLSYVNKKPVHTENPRKDADDEK